MPSFDVVSKLDQHEVDNARNQASKELAQRYDFKGTESTIEQTDEGIVIRSNSEGRLDAARDVLESKMVRRQVSLKSLDPQQAQQAGGQMWRQLIKLKEGVSKEKAKELGDELIVVVASDDTVRTKKHEPIMPEEMRAKMIMGLKPVDQVLIGYKGDPYKIVEEIRPDIIVIGSAVLPLSENVIIATPLVSSRVRTPS